MTELNKDVEALVAQHLPAMAANELGKFIEQAKQDKLVLATTQQELESAKQEVKELRARSSAVEQIARNNTKQAEENELFGAKLRAEDMRLELARNKLVADVALAELKGVKDTMTQFLRNITVRTNVVESVGVPVAGAMGTGNYPGTPGFVAPTHQSRSTTTEQE